MNNTEKYNELAKVDITKFICAMLVVCLHCRPLECYPHWDFVLTEVVSTMAVPMFGAYAGCFFFKKKSIVSHINYVRKVFELYVVWTIIYLPLIIWNYISDKKYEGYTFTQYAFNFGRRFAFLGSWTPLWFLLSLTYSIVFVWIIYRIFNIKILLLLSFVLYIFGCLLDSSAWILPEHIRQGLVFVYINKLSAVKNAFLFLPMFISVGALVAYMESRDIRIIKRTVPKQIYCLMYILMVVWGCALHYGEQMCGGNAVTHSQGFAMIIVVFLICKWSMSESKLLFSVKYLNMRSIRKVALLIYLIHPFLAFFIQSDNKLIATSVVYVLALILSVLILELGNNPYFFWTKILY